MTEHPSWETAVFFKVTESQGYANIWQCITSLSILWYITMLTPITVTRWQRRSFDWHMPLWFLLCSLKRTVSLLFSGRDGSFSAGLAENTCEQKLVCIHKWTDLSGRFDWKEMCFFPLSLSSLSLYTRHPVKLMQHKQSIWRQRAAPLAHWIMARHEGDENFCFISFAVFLSPHPSSCRRWNIKEELLLIQAINDSHKVWFEFSRFFPIACFLWVTQDSSNNCSPSPYLNRRTIRGVTDSKPWGKKKLAAAEKQANKRFLRVSLDTKWQGNTTLK